MRILTAISPFTNKLKVPFAGQNINLFLYLCKYQNWARLACPEVFFHPFIVNQFLPLFLSGYVNPSKTCYFPIISASSISPKFNFTWISEQKWCEVDWRRSKIGHVQTGLASFYMLTLLGFCLKPWKHLNRNEWFWTNSTVFILKSNPGGGLSCPGSKLGMGSSGACDPHNKYGSVPK